MDRTTLLAQWDNFWTTGLFAAPASKAFDDLTAAQAAWTPAAGHHGVWHNANHIMFWRRYAITRARKGVLPDNDEVNRRNWLVPTPADDLAWASAKQEWQESHQFVREAIADESLPADTAINLLAHDSYHLGQIMYVRALQGMKPIE